MVEGVEEPTDWVPAPNIGRFPDVYEQENEALARDGRLDDVLYRLAPWDGASLLDVGCGTGFWLERYADRAAQVFGIEPDPALVAAAAARMADRSHVTVRRGSAEHLPLDDRSIDVAHARFAYFFGPGSERGLDEVARTLSPSGVLLVIDNSWWGGDFARLLRSSNVGNAEIDPEVTDRWWDERGARRHEVHGGWVARSRDELDRILRIEFPATVVDHFMADHDAASLTYRFAVYEWRP